MVGAGQANLSQGVALSLSHPCESPQTHLTGAGCHHCEHPPQIQFILFQSRYGAYFCYRYIYIPYICIYTNSMYCWAAEFSRQCRLARFITNQPTTQPTNQPTGWMAPAHPSFSPFTTSRDGSAGWPREPLQLVLLTQQLHGILPEAS